MYFETTGSTNSKTVLLVKNVCKSAGESWMTVEG